MADVLDYKFAQRHLIGDGCWEWTGDKTSAGYGVMPMGSRKDRVYAHRYSHELSIGPIPAGFDIDHLCRNTSCVRPDHLEAVTQGENIRRGFASRGPRELCAKALHPMSDAYVYPNGRRRCRECYRSYRKVWDAR